MGTKEIAYMRWTADEYRHVAANALGFLDQGMKLIPAYRKGQVLALPKKRHRSAEELEKAERSNTTRPLTKYVEQMRALSPEALAPFLAPPRPEPEPKPPREPRVKHERITVPKVATNPKGTRIDWVTREKALLAREVQRMQEAGDTRALSTQFIVAQQKVLESARWRASTALHAANSVGTLKKSFDEGVKAIWMLAAEPEATVSEPITGSDLADMERAVDNAALLQRAAEGAVPAPSGLAAAGQAFADTLHAALGTLLQAHAQYLLGQLEAHTADMAQTVANAMAAQIQQGLKSTVHAIIQAELGPVAAPAEAVPAAPAAPSFPVTPSTFKRIKFDVVGFEIGAHEQAVIHQLNGHKEKVEINFVHPDKMSAYAPHKGRNVIIVTSRIPHSLAHKIKASGVEPTYVKRTPGHVVHAIEAACDVVGA